MPRLVPAFAAGALDNKKGEAVQGTPRWMVVFVFVTTFTAGIVGLLWSRLATGQTEGTAWVLLFIGVLMAVLMQLPAITDLVRHGQINTKLDQIIEAVRDGGPIQSALADGGPIRSALAADGPIQTALADGGPIRSALAADGPIQTALAGAGPIQSALAPDGPIQTALAGAGPIQTALAPDGPLQTALAPAGAIQKPLGEVAAQFKDGDEIATLVDKIAGLQSSIDQLATRLDPIEGQAIVTVLNQKLDEIARTLPRRSPRRSD